MSPNPYVKSLFIRILWCCIWFQDVSTIRTFSIEMHYWFRFISSEVSISGTLSLAVLLFIWCAFAVWYLGKTPREFRARGNQGNRVVLTSTCVRLDLNILGFLWSVSQICRLVVPVVTLSYRGSNQQFSNIPSFSLCRVTKGTIDSVAERVTLVEFTFWKQIWGVNNLRESKLAF